MYKNIKIMYLNRFIEYLYIQCSIKHKVIPFILNLQAFLFLDIYVLNFNIPTRPDITQSEDRRIAE